MGFWSSGILVFALALVPVFLLYRTIRGLQAGLNDPSRRRSAAFAGLIRMPLLILAAPVFMTIWMLVESGLDPDFVSRSFEDPELVNPVSVFSFAIDQTVRAVAVDALETFRVELSPLRHTCQSVLFCTSLVIYKGMVGLVATVWILSALSWAAHLFDKPETTPDTEA